MRSGNPREVKNWGVERIRVHINNSLNFICRYSMTGLWSDCKTCDGKREDCKARWSDMDKPIVYVHSLEFVGDQPIRKYLLNKYKD